MDKLITKGKRQRDASYQHLKDTGYFKAVSKSALGKGYNDDDSASDDDDGDDEEGGEEKDVEMKDA